jgi:YfiH family protein
MMVDMTLPEPNDGFRWTQVGAGPVLVCRALEPFAPHLFTTRPWPLGAGRPIDRPDAKTSAADPSRPWADVAAAIGVEPNCLIRVRQVHGADVLVRRPGGPVSTELAEAATADIVIADDPSVALAIQTADCVPILMFDRRSGAVAAAHAGWRGLAAGVPRVTIDALARQFGSRPTDLVVAAGPSIGSCCYEVGEEVRRRFEDAGFGEERITRWFSSSASPSARNPTFRELAREPRPGHWYFDSAASVRDQLHACGVSRENIHVAGLCTASHPDVFCSYRRDGAPAGRMAAAIRLKKSQVSRLKSQGSRLKAES